METQQSTEPTLEDFYPKKAIVRIEKIYKATQKDLVLEPLCLEDEAWLKQNFNNEQMEKILKLEDAHGLMTIVWKLLTDDSKELIGTITVKKVDSFGRSKETGELTGVEKLLLLTHKSKECVEILQAILDTFGISRPVVKAIIENEEKKKIAQSV